MRAGSVVVALAFGAGLALAQTAPASPTVASGTRINAELKTKLDSQHAQVGDKVTAVTTAAIKQQGATELPKGSILTGHVTQVTKAESKKSPSHLGVLFDQAATKKGQIVPLHAAIAAVFAASSNAAMDSSMGMPQPGMPAGGGMASSGGMAGGGLLGGGLAGNVAGGAMAGAGEAVNRTTATAEGTADGRMQTLGDEPLPPQFTQANGEIVAMARASNGSPLSIAMPRPSVGQSASAAGQASFGSVISTPRGDVKLDSGTQVQLIVLGSAH